MQLSLFPVLEEFKQQVLWCRSVSGSTTLFVIGVSTLPPLVLRWLAPFVQAHASLPSGNMAFLVRVPPSLTATFSSLPAPRGGSRHESNYLPW